MLLDSNTERNNLIYTVAAGGPLIKDRLFLYGLYRARVASLAQTCAAIAAAMATAGPPPTAAGGMRH